MRKEWNTEEIDYLKEHIGVHKITTIAQRMGRSYNSVIIKMNRLGLANTKLQTGYLTLGELGKHLKVHHNTIYWWMKKHDLPYKKRVTRKSQSFYFIYPSDFWKWANMNKEKVQFSNIEPQVLLPEPDWVDKERRKDIQVVKKRTYQHWTIKEDQKLLELRKKGLTYTKIGEKMNRSSISIERRYKRIL